MNWIGMKEGALVDVDGRMVGVARPPGTRVGVSVLGASYVELMVWAAARSSNTATHSRRCIARVSCRPSMWVTTSEPTL